MSKRTIEVNDVLPECVESAIEDVREVLQRYCKENKPSERPCMSNDLDYDGSIHEIVDGACPIYDADIRAAWFLHGNDLEEACENAGVGDNPREDNGTAAIYYYIYEKVAEWYEENAEDVWHECCSSEE